ncbi:ATP-binding cassette domain-containing protein [Sporolactobacillus kofuensis]|uniref:ATP-binding cassette domain-containing protein n=1 Tax=Sporolactobacillus kofuensis TaxID=269672 RepID=A0ABW1WCG3_9BACL|nr:ATP-binding cassette domain-containing protein [Sporolactobacillus kofuensis]MCO7174882.1 ATP-binding cassette domain-containing protein [Sporolactobacillus kofuensis]
MMTKADVPLVKVDHLIKSFGGKRSLFSKSKSIHAVKDVSLSINRGETFGLIGESGSGKTTIGRMIMKLMDPTDGQILYDGKSISHFSKKEMKDYRSKVQIIFQDSGSAFNPRRPIGKQIAYPLIKNKKYSQDAAMKEVYHCLEMVGLRKDFANRYPHQLSGGQRQRAGIARALVLHPEFLVLDEPVSALDVSVKAQIVSLLENLQKEFNFTYLFIAHNLDLVAYFCDRVAVMYKGEIVEVNTAQQIFRHPQNKVTKKLLGSILTLDGSLNEIKSEAYEINSIN